MEERKSSDGRQLSDWNNATREELSNIMRIVALCGSVSVVHPHCYLQCIVCVQIIGCICILAINPTLTSNRKQGSSNRAPLRFSESHSAKVKWEDVGSDVHGFVVHTVSMAEIGREVKRWWTVVTLVHNGW
jgi:hypothetical protein